MTIHVEKKLQSFARESNISQRHRSLLTLNAYKTLAPEWYHSNSCSITYRALFYSDIYSMTQLMRATDMVHFQVSIYNCELPALEIKM